MNVFYRVLPRGVWFVWPVALLLAAVAETVPTRTQTVELRAGWNSVYLAVDPLDPTPAVVFDGAAVDIAAANLAAVSTAQFISDPGIDLLRQSGWAVWYAGTRPDAFLTTLHAVHGGQAYLLHATRDFRWQVTGAVLSHEILWRADAFNLVGLPVGADAPPTFADFFAGSRAHSPLQVYRLDAGVWRRVLDPQGERVQPGEAYWVYCHGASRHQGPLEVRAPTHRGLVLAGRGGALLLRNRSELPVEVTVEHVPGTGGGLPLAMVIQVVGDPRRPLRELAAAKPLGAWSQPLPPLDAGAAIRVPLRLRQEAMTDHILPASIRIATDVGTEHWIPVFGVRPDLASNR